ncbi:helix-turn-helix domain-containing protein [Microbacterium terrisoli]|uniref:helix-turn-helix domain-containing protein n=1 Tax=Microbacterium terrisoli TaxID=3242192 RepID=UPI002805CBCB|nr:helix-turn-helix transcriptional regulator [Microbacterium protaetiae]
MAIHIHIDRLLVERNMAVGDFADDVGITPSNVAVLKNGRARAVRFTTLDAMCRVLKCQPGDILSWGDDDTVPTQERGGEVS